MKINTDVFEAIQHGHTEVMLLDGLQDIHKHEIRVLTADGWSKPLLVYVIAVRDGTLDELLANKLFTIDEAEQWIGSIQDRREENLKKHVNTLVQFKVLNDNWKKMAKGDVPLAIDLAYEMLFGVKEDAKV